MQFATVAAMRRIEELDHQKNGTSYYQMMQDAGNRAAALLCERYSFAGKRVTVLCGRGNNGGDGLVVAARLHEQGAEVTVALVKGAPPAEPASLALQDLPRAVQLVSFPVKSLSSLLSVDYIVDALYGIGFSGEPADEDEILFALCRQSSAIKLAMDLPSGACGDSGRYTDCLEADLTVAMACWKPAHLVSWRDAFCGEVLLADTPLSTTARESGLLLHTLTQDFCVLPDRKPWSHKGDNGRLAVVCGSRSYSGAAVLSCMGALRSGAGYVHLFSTAAVCATVAHYCPEVIYTVLPETEQGGIDGACAGMVADAVNRCSAGLLGCGLGDNAHTARLTNTLLERSAKPLLLDADALNALSGDLTPLLNASCPVVLTPHPGEFSRLGEAHILETNGDLTLAAARVSADTGAALLLKGPITAIFRGMQQPVFSFMGNDGLARGGSGDLLSGIIVALLAQGLAAGDAVLTGAWLHGRAAELADFELNRRSMLASDVAEFLPFALDELEGIERC